MSTTKKVAAPSVTLIAARIMKERAAAGAPISREESFALAFPIYRAEATAFSAQTFATMTADGTLDKRREIASMPKAPNVQTIIAEERDRHMRAGLTLEQAIKLAHKESIAAIDRWKAECLAHSKEFQANLAAEKAAAANAPNAAPPIQNEEARAKSIAMREQATKQAKARNAKIAERVTQMRSTVEYVNADYHALFRKAMADIDVEESEAFFEIGKAV